METRKLVDTETLRKHVHVWLEELEREQRPREHVLAELEAKLAKYEEKYGRPSEDVSEAVARGEIDETYEVCMWIMDYREWRDLKDGG